MHRNVFTLILFSLFSIGILSQQNDNSILASIENHEITLSEFGERYSNYLFSTGAKDNLVVREAILDNMINEILLYYYDSNENIINSPDYQKKIEENRLRIILAYLKDREVYAKITVTEQEMREAFLRVNEKIAARHLFAKTEEEANNLYELASIGVDFGILAKQVFTDSVLQNNGGYLGYFTWGDMDPAFEDAAYSLKVGEISKPVQTEYGFSIIKLEDRIITPLLTELEYQSKKSHLENVIKVKKKKPSEKEYLMSIFDLSKLTFNDEILREFLVNLYTSKNAEFDENDTEQQIGTSYGDKNYTLSEIKEMISELPSGQSKNINSIENLKAVIGGILIRDSLYSIAISKGYDTLKVVGDKIENYNKSTYLQFKREEIISGSQLPDSTVLNYYKKNISLFSTERELNLQEILVDNEVLANDIVESLSDGIDFGELAEKYSIRKWSAENDGILGFSPLSKFGSYGNLFWEAQLGEIIGPVKMESVYGIFRVLEKKESKPIDFNEVKTEVTKACQLENQKDILEHYLKNLRGKVN
ncbi:MAG TPA: peptidylprolyl isomerase, partial [Ignavibacteriaceae bacterium]